MSFLDEIKQTTANALDQQEQERRAAAVAAQKAKQARIEQFVTSAKTTVAEEVRTMIRAEAARGERVALYQLQLWDDEPLNERARIVGGILAEIFSAEGFKTRICQSENHPCGSDSMFDTTVYTAYFKVSW